MLRSTIAHSYPKMINFDVVDFSECCSKEGISFFWCSMYILNYGIRTRGGKEYVLHWHLCWINLCFWSLNYASSIWLFPFPTRTVNGSLIRLAWLWEGPLICMLLGSTWYSSLEMDQCSSSSHVPYTTMSVLKYFKT